MAKINANCAARAIAAVGGILLLANASCERPKKDSPQSTEGAYSLNGTTVSVKDLRDRHPREFYNVDRQTYQIIRDAAIEDYADHFFADIAKAKNISKDSARDAYLKEHAKVTAEQIEASVESLPKNPPFDKMSYPQKVHYTRRNLENSKRAQALQTIAMTAIVEKKLIITSVEPQEPRIDVKINAQDAVRYASTNRNSKKTLPEPGQCVEEQCPITVVEYTNLACATCTQSHGMSEQILAAFKGKIRWVGRTAPSNGGPTTSPDACYAALCARDQGHYWELYDYAFSGTKESGKRDWFQIATELKLDQATFKSCMADAERLEKILDDEYPESGQWGAIQIPTYYVNGLKVVGSPPFETFSQIISNDLSK